LEVLGPTVANAGDAVEFTLFIWDGGDPPQPIRDMAASVTVDIPAGEVSPGDGDFDDGSGDNGAPSVVLFTGPTNGNLRGQVVFTWNTPGAAVAGDTFEFSIVSGDGSTTHTVTVE